MPKSEAPDHFSDSDIAIVGMACRFPGAKNLDELWQNLRDGVESVSFLSDDELEVPYLDSVDTRHPDYVKAASLLDGIDLFDAGFFGYTPREAEIMDPQHRLFLECAWEALEHAGYDPERYKGAIGVYAGAKTSTYVFNLFSNRDEAGGLDLLQVGLGNDLAMMTTRVAYKLNLRGPAYSVQTACSTGLVAVHLACQSLLLGECQMALAGGVAITVPQKMGYLYQQGGILSPDGHCRVFDAKAAGTVFGNGVGVVVLKRLADALADRDHISAVIKGTATNNDGSSKASFTAPSVEGQADVILEALAVAGLNPETISYVEAHGTGTYLGDPIEIRALTKAYRAYTDKKRFCAVGSIKANFGHLDAAAGVAGLIKTVLALEHKLLPSSLHFEQPNPNIDFENSPFYVNDKLSEWKSDYIPRRAGLSSFGFGGTNAHAILEEAPSAGPSEDSRPCQLLALSARTDSALETATRNLASHLRQHPDMNLADVAYALQTGRKAFDYRRVAICRDVAEAVHALETLDAQRVYTDCQRTGGQSVAFMFPGQGAQYVNMGSGLYQTEPTFRRQVDLCAELLEPHLGVDLRTVLYPGADQAAEAAKLIDQTFITQPALFTVEYALAQVWIEWGIRPLAMIGHSIGEYVAACLAGVFSLEDALALVAARGRMMQALPGGAMLAVHLPEDKIKPLLGQELDLATVNAPNLCVVSGPASAVEGLQSRLAEQDVVCRRLHTSHAFHSKLMDPILAPFVEQVKKTALKSPAIPYASNVTGQWITAEEATDPGYWARHLRQTVRFAEGLHTVLQRPTQVLLEVGPGTTLSTLARQHPDMAKGQSTFSSLRHPSDYRSDPEFSLTTLGRLWLIGVQADWPGFYTHEHRRRVPLPTCPFERQRYWIEPKRQAHLAVRRPAVLQKRPDIADWFYVPVWKPSDLPDPAEPGGLLKHKQCWLVFSDTCGLGAQITGRLRQAAHDVIVVTAGEQFGKSGDGVYTVNPQRRADYETLLQELGNLNKIPQMVLHLWSVTPDGSSSLGESFDQAQAAGFYSLLFLVQALAKRDSTAPLRIEVVSSSVQSVVGGETLCPEKATVLGPCLTIPQEYPHITCSSVDLILSEILQDNDLIDRLLAEFMAQPSDVTVAYRGGQRWVQAFEATPLGDQAGRAARLRDKGVYLITGGLGGIGLALAGYLAQTVQARLVLTGRSAFPARPEWEQWLAAHDGQDPVSQKIRKVQRLDEMGAQVLIACADAGNQEQMRRVVAQAYDQFGEIHGVIHCAGTPGGASFKPIREIGQAECELHFQSKARGLFALETVLRGKTLDFCLLQSSLSSVLGGLGSVAYSAANLFMDAFAWKQNRAKDVPWISVNWDIWSHAEAKEKSQGLGAALEELSITPGEGVEAFQRILSADAGTQILVSTGDLQTRIDQWVKLESLRDMQLAGVQGPSHQMAQDTRLPAEDELRRRIATVWQRVLGVKKVGINDNFFDLGGNSLTGIQLVSELKRDLGVQISPVTLFEAPTVRVLAERLAPRPHPGATETRQEPVKKRRRLGQNVERRELAIIGLAGRFPGAKSIDEFWQNLRDGVESIKFFSDEELTSAGIDPAVLSDPHYVKARSVLDGIELFDASFFGYSPRDAEIMDPQHRLFMECAWEALENAGYDPERYSGSIGVFAGAGMNSYLLNNLYSNRDVAGSVSTEQILVGNDKDSLTTAVSYKLNLKGPSLAVQTFCSTGLVAAHLACQSLLNDECDMALAGGVSIAVPQTSGYRYQEGGILSPDGHCRAFDSRARGAVFGNGVGAVVLKRLEDALADGDCIYAVIKGSAINNDGSLKVGYTAPSVDGQAEAIAKALSSAGVDAETISYVEAHGTGTAMGDPIEIAALTKAFRTSTHERNFCAIGSVKTNIGHLDRAAGVAGLIKTVLALKHGMLPPSLNFREGNPKIDFANSPFYVNTTLCEWKTDGMPRRAGVSSLGFGGTNAHLVLEEAPVVNPSDEPGRWELLLLSAKTQTALESATANLAEHLLRHPELNLADVAFTLQVGRQLFEHRRVIMCQSLDDAVTALETLDSRRVLTGAQAVSDRPVVFMFTGQGAQYVNMGQGLYQHEPIFRERVDRCAMLLQPHLSLDLRQVLYPDAAETEAAAQQLGQTWLTQPALFVVEYALAGLWMEWGVRPQMMIGHSVGEYVAACLAGVFDLEDALSLVAARGRLMQSVPPGSMLSISLSEADVQPWLNESLSIAVVNEPSRCVVAGPTQEIDALEQRLTEKGIACRRLHTSHAFHSAMMEPILETFREKVGQVRMQAPRIPYISNVTGALITPEQATDPAYWVQHLRRTVRFSDGVRLLGQTPHAALLEVGPGHTLRTLAQHHPDRAPGQIVLSSMRHAPDQADDQELALRTLSQLWSSGVQADWQAFHTGRRRLRVPLPTYPFERKRYWIEPRKEVGAQPVILHKNPDITNWFYVPSWKRTMPPVREPETGGCWLVFSSNDSLSALLTQQLEAQGYGVITVLAGDQFAARDGAYTVHPARRADYEALFAMLSEQSQTPTHIIHLWNVLPLTEDVTGSLAALQYSFYSLLHLTQAIGTHYPAASIQLAVVSSNLHKVTSDEMIHPEKAPLLGPCKIIPREMSNIVCRSVDIVRPEAGSRQEAQMVEQIIAELEAKTSDSVIAYRGYDRWVQNYETAPLTEVKGTKESKLRPGGVYLITGGLGGMGLALAAYLARTVRAKLILIGRSHFPERDHWEQWLATHGPRDRTSERIQSVRALEALGAEVLVAQADVANRGQMEAVVRAAYGQFGAIHGVIHAAGLPSGGMILLKTESDAANVLAPKVQGTRTLEAVLHDIPLDFMVLCSSNVTATGDLGQVDYCAANAFMDAFAHDRSGRSNTMTVAIDWDVWSGVGMAVNTPAAYTLASAAQPAPATVVDHPLLTSRCQEMGEQVYQMELSPAKHWVLAEHKLGGIPIFPGTAYLELAHAAFTDMIRNQRPEVREAIFLTPLMVGESDSKQARLVLKEQPGGFDFQVVSQAGMAADGELQWQTHVIGQLGPMTDAVSQRYDLEAIRARCNVSEITVTAENARRSTAESFMEYGPRWSALKRVDVGHDEGLAWIELDEQFLADLEGFKLHPALLDVATGFAVAANSASRYLPLSYKHVRVYDSLPARFYSYVRLKPGSVAGEETMTVQATLIDERGQTIVDIEEITMKRIEPESISRPRDAGEPETIGNAGQLKSLQRDFSYAISPEQGVQVFQRVLFRNRLPQIVVCTRHLPTVIQQAGQLTDARLQEGATQLESPGTRHPRPNLQTPFVTARNEIEAELAGIWQTILGVDSVGIHDNFFELGGDSVMGIQVMARLREAGFQIDPGQIFQHQTIAELAGVLQPASATGAARQPSRTESGTAADSAPWAAVQPAPLSAGGYTPSDFPEANVSQEELDRLAAQFDGTEEGQDE